MTDLTQNVSLALADGTTCSVVFTAGEGASVFKREEQCGSLDDAELAQYAARRHGAMEFAAQVEEMFDQALTTSSQDALMDAAYRWFEQNF